MELRQLEYFMVLCKELHFTRAAEKLNISQPSLSQQIRTIEDEVGVPLFDRIGKKIAITEAGRILLSHSQKIFFELEQAQAALSELNGLKRGKLTIGALLTVVSYLLPQAILAFNKLYPNIELSALGLRTDEIRRKLLENELDLGIVFLPMEDDEFDIIPLFTEELTLAVPVDHELAQERQVDMSILDKVPTVLLPQNYYLRQLIHVYCSPLGFLPKPILEMSTLESLIHMVSEGVGVSVLPKPYLEFLKNEQIKIVQIVNPTPTREIGIIYRKDKYMCAATKRFIAQLTITPF